MILVLIVDNHDFLRARLQVALSNADGLLVVGECADGDQALIAVGALRPNLVLMDRQMPGMNGVTATRALMAANPSLNVVMISATGNAPAVREAAAAGASGYLIKDGNPAELIAAIRAVAAGIPIWPDRPRSAEKRYPVTSTK
jgi:DNA-binding NarL/FixJ family response regulator